MLVMCAVVTRRQSAQRRKERRRFRESLPPPPPIAARRSRSWGTFNLDLEQVLTLATPEAAAAPLPISICRAREAFVGFGARKLPEKARRAKDPSVWIHPT